MDRDGLAEVKEIRAGGSRLSRLSRLSLAKCEPTSQTAHMLQDEPYRGESSQSKVLVRVHRPGWGVGGGWMMLGCCQLAGREAVELAARGKSLDDQGRLRSRGNSAALIGRDLVRFPSDMC